ncbi:MAG: hypothetical protein GY850_15610 [bacterium]|nr:hypothetical protein [bacterium]
MKQVIAACLFSVLLALSANADIIYFKNGLKTICQDKAWEENGQVKCEYEGWILSYKKSDVLRILSTTPLKQPAPSQKKPQVQTKTKPLRSGTQKQNQSKSEGIVFYDPRRPYIYWTDKTTRHKSFKEAIKALAEKYDRPTEWIQANLGDTNDLNEIHRNLAESNSSQAKTTIKPSDKKKPTLEFYSPRRPFPYWTDVSTKHKRFNEAINVLAQKYERTPEWIQQYMGQTNDLAEIHQNLQTRIMAETSE